MIGDVVVSAAGSTTIVDSRTQAEKAMHLQRARVADLHGI